MAEVTSGKNLTVIVLNEEEADALSIALSMVYGTEDLDEVFGQALMHYKQDEVPTFDYDPLFDLIWKFGDGEVDMEDATTLNEDLWDEDGFHPWDGLRYGYELETRCTWQQTLETPAEYLTVGRLWILNADGKELAERGAGDFQ